MSVFALCCIMLRYNTSALLAGVVNVKNQLSVLENEINALLFRSVSNASAQLGDVYIDTEISSSVANDYIDEVLIQFRSVAINTIGQFSLFILERLAHFSDVLKRAIDNLQLGNKLKIQIVITPEEMDLNGIFASLGSD